MIKNTELPSNIHHSSEFKSQEIILAHRIMLMKVTVEIFFLVVVVKPD